MTLLAETIARIGPLDEAAMGRAREREGMLTKPPGSLGRLEDLAIQLAGIVGNERPALRRKAIVIMAGDHGVTAEGVSAYPAAVTPQMVANFLAGGAAINALARSVGARVTVVDVGVNADLGQGEGGRGEAVGEDPGLPVLLHRKVGWGTANAMRGAAMRRE